METAHNTSAEPTTPFDPNFPAARRRLDAAFVPPRCPHAGCAAHSLAPARGAFAHRRRGTYIRKLDGRSVQRFECLACSRSFSSQSFRLDYRLQRPETLLPVFAALHSKSTLRKTARNLGLTRAHVARRVTLLAGHGRDYHELQLDRLAAAGGLGASFQFDELETYETHRKLKPVTACVLIERRTGFIVSTEVGRLAARGPRTPKEEAKRLEYEERDGRRRSDSWNVVQRTAAHLARVARASGHIQVTTDRKASYARALMKCLGGRLVHERISGRAERGTRSLLFPINHTLARLRDLASRLVRQTWAASKVRSWLVKHLAVVVGFRNYVDGWRSEPKDRQRTSAATELGVTTRKLSPAEYLEWRDPLCAPR